ncbi:MULTISPECIES: DUF1385 domain-containing protein [Enorma]|uniref:DUF1385 domain-containing protein n=1 Tax=Enorma TaxID=1472762 RepID=UPI0003483B6F|nr:MULTISPECIES: DUF1385 domain-containing protein [Enorma]
MLAARGADAGELFQTHIGGSAVLEGVMMRGRCGWAVSVRTDSGGMYVEERALPDAAERPAWQKLPIVRGCVSFVESMRISYEALSIAVDHVCDEAPGGAAEAGAVASAPGGETGTPRTVQDTAEAPRDAQVTPPAPPADVPDEPSDAGMFASVAVGVLLGVALFVALPVSATNLLMGDLQAHNSLAWNLVEAAFRLAVLVAYIWGVGRLPDMARVFAYHGAEHQAIHCYEHGLDLTPENCMRFSRLHVRCGTAFIVMTVIIAVAVNAVVPVGALADALGATGIARWLVVFASRLVLLPLVMGISYEITVRWAGKHPDNPLVRIVLWPGLQMQRLTTRVPDRGMLECAISSLVRVRAQEVRAERARM